MGGGGESYHAINSFLATLTRSCLCALYTDRIHRNRTKNTHMARSPHMLAVTTPKPSFFPGFPDRGHNLSALPPSSPLLILAAHDAPSPSLPQSSCQREKRTSIAHDVPVRPRPQRTIGFPGFFLSLLFMCSTSRRARLGTQTRKSPSFEF